MQIIVEGPDGSGKSTLILALAKLTGWKIVSGEGPEKEPGEMMRRIERYLKEARYAEGYSTLPRIFDRHPCVSQPIYSKFNGTSVVCAQATDKLYELKNVVVYCQPPDSTRQVNHQGKPHDRGNHLKAITENHSQICSLYEEWALKRAHLIYRYWEPSALGATIRSIIAATGELQ